jgi:hypothetical protein
MNQYYLPLNVRKDTILKPNFVKPLDGNDNGIYKNHRVQIIEGDCLDNWFTKEFSNKLKSVSDIWGVVIFNHKEIYTALDAHVDVLLDKDNNPYALNYGVNVVFDDSTDIQGVMRWYSMKNPQSENDIQINPGKTPYFNFKIDELILEEEYYISDLVTLVRSSVPHNATSGNEFRTCIHILFKDNFDWEIAVEKFNKTFNHTS